MPKPKLHLVFRKTSPEFNSIENVFEPLIPYFNNEFEVNRVELPYRTSGLRAMLKNVKYLKSLKLSGLVNITGHENYTVAAFSGKTILTLHDIGAASNGKALRDRFILHYWFKKPIEQADCVTVISDFSKEEIGSRYPKYKHKIRTIPNPIDDRVQYTPKDFNEVNPHILFVGTKENKNFDRAVEALRNIPCTLIIIGKLSEQQLAYLEQAKIRYENYTGLAYEEVLDLYKQADFLLFPSLYEGFGIPILEAQGSGRAVITSNIGTMPNTAGSGALLVDPYSVDSIRQGVEQIISDQQLRKDLIEKGLQNVKKYSAARIAQQYISLYKSILNDQ